MSAQHGVDDSFGQRVPPLHVYLKRILDKYPEGGQILKELVQNADDAKARNVVFLYDKSEHPRQRLWSDALSDFQGPALYAYNDASFTEEDWESIQHPEQSGKHDDPTKVGKFGLGFISVYHLTDMPCILSEKQIGYLDPLEEVFNFDPHTETRYEGRRGKRWELSSELLHSFPDQFSLFLNDLFECSEHHFESGTFKGTIFRFPLRKKPSKISQSVFHDEQRILGLMESFKTDAELSLLFLKNVESIAVYERQQRHDDPRLTFQVQIRQEDRQQVRLNTATFLSKIPEHQDFHTVSCLHIDRQHGPQTVDRCRFITMNTLKVSNISVDLKELMDDEELKMLPWMGMSFRISSTAEQGNEEQSGRVFCFLPLPESETTGLPVHVHGYFGLGDNRRSIKWPDQESQHDNKARWNQLLVTEVFPEVYAKLILAAIKKSQDPTVMQPKDVYKGWPDVRRINRQWPDGVKTSLRLLKDEAIFYADNDQWVKPSDVYINTTNNDLISKVLMQNSCPVAQLPDHVIESLQWANVPYQELTPAIVRNCIRGDPLQFLNHDEKLELLEYVTSDCISDLNDLHLLPLGNGEFTSFRENLSRVFIATNENPSELIPNGEGRFAASDTPPALKDPNVESCTQLKFFHITDVAQLLIETLPGNWSNFSASGDVLSWTPGIDHHPSLEWITVIWEWLTRHHMEVLLSTFKDIPLIPMTNNRMARLKENTMIFGKQQKSLDPVCLSENICSFLESVGAVVVRHDLPVHITGHPHLESFIKPPTPKGVMTVLEAVSRNHNIQRICDGVTSLPSDAKDELRDLLAQQCWEATHSQKDILRQLPLCVASDGHYVSAESCVAAVPENYFEIPVKVLKDGSEYMLRSSKTEIIVSSLGVRQISAGELLAENILPAVAGRFYSAEDSLEIMTWVLKRPEIDSLIRELQFVPGTTVQEQLSCPKDLFEPTSTLLMLLRGKNVFPTGVYAQDELLKALKRVGLKTQSDITSTDVLDVAVELSESQETGQADVARGALLLEHINRHPHLLLKNVVMNKIGGPLHKFLTDLYWVPCEASPPQGYPVAAGWMGNATTLYTTTEIGLIDSALLNGSVLPLIKLSDTSEESLRAFSWSKQPSPKDRQQVELVVRHLKNVAISYQSSQDTHAVSHSMSLIYNFLGEAPETVLKDAIATHMNGSQPWVWHGSGFTTPDKIALSIGTLGVSLVPYLHVVPADMQKNRGFLATMGVKSTFQEKELHTVLESVQHKNQTERIPTEEDYQTDLILVRNILTYIVNLDKFDTQTFKILVPRRIAKGQERRIDMVRASECLYVDEERLASQMFDEQSEEEFDKPVIHESISNDVAQRLGLLPLSHFLAPVDEVAYEMAGPHETTVNAIKRNLDMYKNDVDIFKELIQNADDAGATEVKFLLDWRKNEHTAHNLLSDGMKACHGPALWAYNDACFSKDDFKNICSIASQSKLHQLDKVGRFGLGFTSVYHLTDVPSVVSGPYILICDPRTTHLGSRVKPGQPGIKLDLTNDCHRRTLKSYPNQFQPYNGIFGCSLQASTQGFKHTLFRLPLRTEIEADNHQPNQLSDFICDSKDKFHPLIESLEMSAATLVLFTQNVVHVSLQELSEKDGDMKNIMSVTVSRILQMPRSISPGPIDGDFTTQRKLLKATAKYIEDSGLVVPETTMIVKVTRETSGCGKSVETPEVREEWKFITSSCMAMGESLELTRTLEGQKAGVLPCGGIAAQLSVDEGGCFIPEPIEGSAFSYLPINVLTGLPFHVNGNFLLQPNRRQLWGKSSSGAEEFEAQWNTCVMQTVLCSALLNLLEDLQKLQEQNIVDARNFQSLWPKRNVCESAFLPLVDAYYRTIGRENSAPAVIFNQSSWVTVHQCFFTDWTPTEHVSLRDSMKALLAKHQDPKRWVELEPDVVSSISEAGANTCFDDNTFNVERFLRDVFFPALADCQQIEPEHQKQIVLHVLDLRLGERKVTDYDTELKSTQCIPASPNGDRLVRPCQLVNPSTSTGSLYSEEDGRFPRGSEYRKEARLLSLTQLGMASNDLSWEDICERAESMLKGGQFEWRSAILLKLIDEKLRKLDEPTLEQKSRIREAAFLPVHKRPEHYPVEWYACDSEFMPAAALYGTERKELLGSVQPLLDEEKLGFEVMSQKIKIFLGIHEKNVAVSDVVKQLSIVIDKASGITQQTSSMVSNIYSFLQDTICTLYGEPQVNEEHRAAFDLLCTLRLVLCDDGQFRKCSQIAFEHSGQSGPYLFPVSPRHTQFRNLLKVCGVRDKFEVEDYLHTLQLLKEKHEDSPLDESGLKTAKEMMSEVFSQSAANYVETQNSLGGCNIYVPDNCNILRTPSELTFNDVDWEGSWRNNVYTHPDIPYNHAKVFGIKTQRQKHLETCSSYGGFEMEFGQREELTDRLCGILRSYPNVSDVFKELLQNADDVGATEIHFVYDPRSHQTGKIIADSWAPLQELPSLCVFNDKSFSEEDIKGIQKVGVGGKRDDIATTGEFGIGFNAVYHLTDCPSFLSNSDTLCVFDPLLKYVPGTQQTSPGKRFSTGTSGTFRDLFPDMLKGYLEDIEEFCGKKGTMFRFPLRTEPSEVSTEVFCPQRMSTLLDEFQKLSQDALLFLDNIRTITISRIDKETGVLQRQYSISVNLSDVDQQQQRRLTGRSKVFMENPCDDITSMSCLYSLITKDSTGTEKSWLVSQVLGFQDPPLGRQALSNDVRLKKSLPKGGVAAIIDIKQVEYYHQQYKAYCLLPLPIHTELPVHVNGTFELDDIRKNLRKDDAQSGKDGRAEYSLISEWNRLLVEDVVAPAYAKLIKHAGRKILGETEANKSGRDLLKFYNDLFPTDLEALHGEWRLLAEATLRYIGQQNLQVLPVVKPTCGTISWHHPNSDTSLAFFDGLDLTDDSAAGVADQSNLSSIHLRSFLLAVGFNLLTSCPKLGLALQACGVKAEFVCPQAVVKHLLSESVISPGLPAPLEKTAFTDLTIFQEVFAYCLDGVTKPLELSGLPMRLADDNTLGRFSTTDGLYVTSEVLQCWREKHLHKYLVTSCKDWFKKNETSEEAYTSGIFKKFTIDELDRYLEEQLPKEWQGCVGQVEWDPKREGRPSESWLQDLWRFICSEMSDDESQPSLDLEAIENWPIFPTTAGTLVPPIRSKSVLFLQPSSETQLGSIDNALRQLRVPEVQLKQMFDTETTNLTNLLEHHLAMPQNHGDVTGAIQFMLEIGAEIGHMQPAQCTSMLLYFQEGYETNSLTEESTPTIRKLPIFKHLLEQDQTTDIQRYQHCHTVQGYQIPREEANVWMSRMNCVFLDPQPSLDVIYKELGISPITQTDVYLEYILPSFHVLSQEARLKHIANIKGSAVSCASKEEKKAILKCLTATPCILDGSNILQRVGYFFDPDNTVFEVMVDSGKLLPEPWMHLSYFLEKIGLHRQVTQDHFVKFAKEIETDANQTTNEDQLKVLHAKAEHLKKELDSNEKLHDPDFLESIAKIRFIPSASIEQKLLDIYPAYSESNRQNSCRDAFIACNGSVPFRHLKLVWSVSPVLPYWAVPYFTIKIDDQKYVKAERYLGIVTDDHRVMDKVLSHTELVSERIERENVIDKEDKLSDEQRTTIKYVMKNILGYLRKHLSKHRDTIKRSLQFTPICLVEDGRVLVRADKLVLNMDRDHECSLRPYLYKVPRESGAFDDIYILLGAQHYSSFDQLAGVLSTLKAKCGDKRLPPNEQKSTKTAVGEIFMLLRDRRRECQNSRSELYLPSSEFILRKSSHLYYADPDLMEQLNLASIDKEFILPLEQVGFQRAEEVDLIRLLPERLRPKYLPDEMQERPCPTNEDCRLGEDCRFLAHIKSMVNSPEMTQVLRRLYRHQMSGKEPFGVHISCIGTLQNFTNFLCKKELKIGLYNTFGETIGENLHPRKAFFDQSTRSLYLEHNSWPLRDYTSAIFSKISKCCNDILGGLLDAVHVSHLQTALDSPSADKMNEVLSSECSIPEYDEECLASKPDEHQPGKIIPRDIRHLLDQDPHNIFHEKEIVGYERSLDDRSESPTTGTTSSERGTFNDATEIIFAIIVEQIDKDQESVNLSRRYKINIGQQQHIIVSVTTLFKFLTPKEKDDNSTSNDTLPADPRRDREQIKKEVSEVFALPKEEQKRVIHRLYRKWHPDKNPGKEERTNEAFKFLKEEIKRHDSTDQYSRHYTRWESEVNRDREEANRYRGMYNRSRGRRRNRSRTNNVPPSFSRETPDPHSARLWFRQAKEHFSSADETSQRRPAQAQWIAFQIHQAAELALKAAQYNLTGHPDDNDNNLTVLASTVCRHRHVTSDMLINIAGDLERLNCQFDKPRYPESWSSLTSGEVYQGFSVEAALKLCKALLTLVEKIIEIQ